MIKRNIDETAKLLSEAFPKDVEAQLSKGNTKLTYIPIAEVINRLNRILGIDAWSSTILDVRRDSIDPDHVIAQVRLTVTLWEGYKVGNEEHERSFTIYRDGVGGQKVKKMKSGEPVDLGDEFKGAVSDALKKAATTFGIALYLARDESALAYDIDTDPVWDNFLSLSRSLNEAGKKKLNTFWSTKFGDKPKPKADNYNQEELNLLAIEAARILLDGEYVA